MLLEDAESDKLLQSLVALQLSSGKPRPHHCPIKPAMKKNPITRCLPAFLLGAALLRAGPALEKQADGVVLALDNA
ncbi:MAG TPA: hypothetical protein VFC28_03585, partial [Opitutaceae bacterium]|nr:hypothetical protein [Opitutaceae bacterium]